MLLSKVKITNGLTVLLLTAGSYLAAFLFQAGYLRHFNIDTYAIDINLPIFIISLIGTTIAIVATEGLLDPYSQWLKNLDRSNHMEKWFFRISFYVMECIFFTVVAYSWTIPDNQIIAVFLIFFLLVVSEAAIPAIHLRRQRGWSNAVKKHISLRAVKGGKSSVDQTDNSILVLRAVIILGIALAAGKFNATLATGFPVVRERDGIHTLLIEKQSSTILTKQYDVKLKKWLDGYTLEQMPGQLHIERKTKIKD